jgi:hypothetical protein
MDCPYCKEDIKDEAIKCKHCGSSIEAPVEVAMVDFKKKQSSGVQSLINDGYTLDISSYFSKSWDVFKKYPGGFIGFTVLWLVVVLIPIVGSFVQIFLQSVIISGYYFVYKKISQGERYQFNNFFDGFSYFLPLFLAGLVGGILIFIGTLLLIIPGVYLAVAYIFTSLLIIDKKMKFWEAMETSRKLVTKQWFPIFGLSILVFLLSMSGMIAFFIGVIITIPIGTMVISAAYEDIVGFEE